MARSRSERSRVPLPALMLGASGLLPPIVAIIARLSAGSPPDTPLPAFLTLMALLSATLILAFLGGIWWGVALGRGATDGSGDGFGGLLALAIAPTIVALLIAALSGWMPKTGAGLLAAAIVATLLVDRGLKARGLVPGWWMRLRVPLSLALGALTAVLALLM